MTLRLAVIALILAGGVVSGSERAAPSPELDAGFADPPQGARVRAFWWWLNGNVTKEAITRDLEWMKRIGMGGALIFDAGNEGHWGHAPVPSGPLFGSPEWRELLKHALREADRLGLEMSLSPQSGWNLGGPGVRPEGASKRVVWAGARAVGPSKLDRLLPVPAHRLGYYRDIAVLAYRVEGAGAGGQDDAPEVTASSSDPDFPPVFAADADRGTYWASGGTRPGEGPGDRPTWLQFEFARPVDVAGFVVLGRPGYGPRECELQASDDGDLFRAVSGSAVEDGRVAERRFDAIRARHFRLVVRSGYDPQFPANPRSLQIAQVVLRAPDGRDLLATPRGESIRRLDLKAGTREMGGSAPDGATLLVDEPAASGGPVVRSTEVRDLTAHLDGAGRLLWDVPEGVWRILRFGYTNNGARVSTSSGAWQGLVVDYLDPDALRSYWRGVFEPILADLDGPARRALKFIQTDSWELGGVNWTANFAEEFRKRRGYDPGPLLPILAGVVVDGREVSHRFLNDLRKTIGDCVADNHYRVLAGLAHEHGLGIHPESGGPHGGPFEALKCLGRSDIPMSEFWAPSPHRPAPENRFFVKQAACAAHTYGKRLVAAEGFTSIGPQWSERPWRDLKPSFDHEACAGLNLVFWHTFTCSPPEMGLPGQEYFAGTHFNPNITWARQAPAFVGYLNRCQFLLQQGQFVADALFYYGDHVPNFVRLKEDDPARVLPGYDYDVCNEEVLLTRLKVRDGRLELPEGPSYRVLVLPNLSVMSLEALRAIHRLVRDGATVIGPRPRRTAGLRGYPGCDAELGALAEDLWGDSDGTTRTEHRFGRGRVFWGKAAREVLAADGVAPDFEFTGTKPGAAVDYIHRTDPRAEIFFLRNRNDRPEEVRATFRVGGRQPELWDPVSGEARAAVAFRQDGGRTILPLEFAPFGSLFVLFRRPIAADASGDAARNFPSYTRVHELDGPWAVTFDPKWGGPGAVELAKLVSWTARPEDGIRYYSGTASYRKVFDLPTPLRSPGRRLALDLGEVGGIAEVRLNGKPLGVLWSPPFRAEITDAARPADNVLEVDVINGWFNRLIGDAKLPPEGRFLRTNIRLNPLPEPQDSGLLGPVTIHSRD
jgi:hypothetical protein